MNIERSEYQKEILSTLQKIEKDFKKKHRCMYPECDKWAISSHSQQKKGQLANIAENGNVIAMKRSILGTIARSCNEASPLVDISIVSINKATTFLGFCNCHDTLVFSDIELRPLIKDTPNQVLAFHRRAVAFEIWNKRKQVAIEKEVAVPFLLDKPELLAADEKYHWEKLWNEDSIKELEFKWIVFDKNIGISLTSCIPCLDDLSFNNYMKSFYDCEKNEYLTSRPAFSLSICPNGDETHIIMCWMKKDRTNVDNCLKRLLDKTTRADFLNECIFVKSEDFCMKPSLWSGLSEEVKDLIKTHLANPSLTAKTPKVLSGDDVIEKQDSDAINSP